MGTLNMGTQTNWVDKVCLSKEWYTPQYILDCVRAYWGCDIPLDPATIPSNPTRASSYYTNEHDGLHQLWKNPVFLNPPYGAGLKDWCARLASDAKTGLSIIALLPCGARFSTRYWQTHILTPRLDAVCFINHRVKFVNEHGGIGGGQNPYDSAIYGYNVDTEKFYATHKNLGKILITNMYEGS